MEPLFIAPVFQEKIWGGSNLHTVFDFALPSDKIGEDWAISAHPHGISVVQNGSFKGKKLDQLWQDHQELFGYQKEETFPLLVKILDAANDLSVQVHPDDKYALEHEGELGKTECWYVIDAKPGAQIIYGHTAKSRAELAEMLQLGQWDKLLRRVTVKKGDFFYVPSGTIHGIGQGIMILETQQSSDTTYRVYDYDRSDEKGNKRPLHLQQSIDVTNVPAYIPDLQISESRQGESAVISYLQTDFFNVYEWQVSGKLNLKKNAPYTLATVIDGYGELIVDGKSYELKMGTSFIIPDAIENWVIQGSVQLIASEPGKKA